MNGDGGNADQGANVDGQNITPNTVTTNTVTATTVTASTVDALNANVTGLLTATDIDVTNGINANRMGAIDGLFENLAFITGRCVPSILAPPFYILPITAPPNDSNTYSICNVPNPSTLTTPATNASFSFELIQGVNATLITVDFLPLTTLDSSFIYSQINNAIANWFTSNGSPSYITLSLNTSAFPYRTNVNVVGASAGISIDVDGTAGMAPLLGYTVTTPFYGTGVTPSPSVTSFSLILSANAQLTWSSLDSSDSLISTIPFEIQSGTGNSSIVCSDTTITAEVNGINRLIIDVDNTKMYSKSFPASGGSGLTVFDSGDIELASYNGLLGSINLFASDPKINITGPGGQSQINLFTDTIDIYNTNGSFATTLREQITPVQQQFMSPDTSTKLTISNTGVRISNAYILPTVDGSNGQVITTNGAGQSSWVTPSLGLFSQTGTQTVNNNVQTSLIQLVGSVGSLSLPVNYLTIGKSLLLKMGGTFRDNIIGTLIRFRFKSNGINLLDTGNITLTNVNTVRAWNIEIQTTYNGANMISNFTFRYTTPNITGQTFCFQASTPINVTIINTLDLTVNWTVTSPNNTITSNYATLTKIY